MFIAMFPKTNGPREGLTKFTRSTMLLQESTARAPLLEVRNVTKAFPGVRALDGVSLDLYPGEIHAVVGENGAGKSTLIKILAGVYTQDTGEICIAGRPIHFRDAGDSRDAG